MVVLQPFTELPPSLLPCKGFWSECTAVTSEQMKCRFWGWPTISPIRVTILLPPTVVFSFASHPSPVKTQREAHVCLVLKTSSWGSWCYVWFSGQHAFLGNLATCDVPFRIPLGPVLIKVLTYSHHLVLVFLRSVFWACVTGLQTCLFNQTDSRCLLSRLHADWNPQGLTWINTVSL